LVSNLVFIYIAALNHKQSKMKKQNLHYKRSPVGLLFERPTGLRAYSQHIRNGQICEMRNAGQVYKWGDLTVMRNKCPNGGTTAMH
jgi:predicted membrane protein